MAIAFDILVRLAEIVVVAVETTPRPSPRLKSWGAQIPTARCCGPKSLAFGGQAGGASRVVPTDLDTLLLLLRDCGSEGVTKLFFGGEARVKGLV